MSKSLQTYESPELGFLNSDEWVSIDQVLETEEGRVGALSLGDQNYMQNGSQRAVGEESLYFGHVEKLKGEYMVLNNALIDSLEGQITGGFPAVLGPEDRNEAGFYIGNSMGSPTELKLDHEPPEKEEWHTHTGYEVYKPLGGEIELGLGNRRFAETVQDSYSSEVEKSEDLYTTETVTEEDYFAVPPNVPHKVVEKEDPSLLIVRYPEEGDTVDKYLPDGTPAYPWSDEQDFQIEPYEE